MEQVNCFSRLPTFPLQSIFSVVRRPPGMTGGELGPGKRYGADASQRSGCVLTGAVEICPAWDTNRKIYPNLWKFSGTIRPKGAWAFCLLR